jgi:hypothetical protein
MRFLHALFAMPCDEVDFTFDEGHARLKVLNGNTVAMDLLP